MLILGEDVSSTSTGFVIVDGEELLEYAVWTPPKRADMRRSLNDLYWSKHEWLDACAEQGLVPDVSICEEPGGGHLGFRTVRAIAKFEGVSDLVNEQREIPARSLKAKQARAFVFPGHGSDSKEQVHALVRDRFPHLRVPRTDQGGEDVLDAYVVALAAPEALRG
jgi:Holliday junction resolvasome RuvABC endonuclease subunit